MYYIALLCSVTVLICIYIVKYFNILFCFYKFIELSDSSNDVGETSNTPQIHTDTSDEEINKYLTNFSKIDDFLSSQQHGNEEFNTEIFSEDSVFIN